MPRDIAAEPWGLASRSGQSCAGLEVPGCHGMVDGISGRHKQISEAAKDPRRYQTVVEDHELQAFST